MQRGRGCARLTDSNQETRRWASSRARRPESAAIRLKVHKEAALSPTPTRTNRGKESRCTPEEGQRAGTADHAPQRDKQCRREPAGRACLGLQGTTRTWLHLPGVATTPHGP